MLVGLLVAGAAQANTWPLFSQRRGLFGHEVEGLPHTAIVHETLTVDLVGVPTHGEVLVEVTYRLSHPGEETHAQLVFLPDTIEKDGIHITFDGRRVPVGPSQAYENRWNSPPSMPGLLDRQSMIGAVPPRTPLQGHSFEVVLHPGEHDLTIQYAVPPGSLSFPRDPVEYRQFLYTLAPAREWDSFGTLHVEVIAPSGWHLNSDPPLDRDVDRYIGDFEGLPGDHLALTFAAPNNYDTLESANYLFGGAAFVLAMFLPILLLNRKPGLALVAAVGAIGTRLLGGQIVPLLAQDPDHISPAFLLGMQDPMYNLLTLLVMGVPACLVITLVWLLLRRRKLKQGHDAVNGTSNT